MSVQDAVGSSRFKLVEKLEIVSGTRTYPQQANHHCDNAIPTTLWGFSDIDYG